LTTTTQDSNSLNAHFAETKYQSLLKTIQQEADYLATPAIFL
jgi:hypothetical protein